MKKTRFWIAFLLVLVFSALMNHFILDNSEAFHKAGKVKRNYIELASVVVSGLVGWIYFSRPKFPIVKILWLAVYISSIVFLFIVALIDNYIYPISTEDGLHRFGSLKEVLISPLFFILLCAFEIILNRKKKAIG